jgi:hypothetical protein
VNFIKLGIGRVQKKTFGDLDGHILLMMPTDEDVNHGLIDGSKLLEQVTELHKDFLLGQFIEFFHKNFFLKILLYQ